LKMSLLKQAIESPERFSRDRTTSICQHPAQCSVSPYDFRIFRPRAYPFPRVAQRRAAKDVRVRGTGRERVREEGNKTRRNHLANDAEGERRNVRVRKRKSRGSASDRLLYSVLVRLPAGYLRWMQLTARALFATPLRLKSAQFLAPHVSPLFACYNL